MQKTRFRDRRIFERISVDLSARLRDPFRQSISKVSCRDISAGGVGVISSQILLPKSSLEIWLDFGDRRESLHLYGKVSWSEQIKGDMWRAGICFDEPQFMTLSRLFI